VFVFVIVAASFPSLTQKTGLKTVVFILLP